MMWLQDITKLPGNLWFLVSVILFVNTGSFLAIPFFTIYLTETLHYSIIFAGVIVSINILTQRVFSLFGGLLVDLTSSKKITICGLLLRAGAYLGLAFATQAEAFIVLSLMMGMGSSLYSPASKTCLIYLCSTEQRALALSLRSTAMNLGVAIGPLLGMLIFTHTPKLIFLLAGFLHLIFSFFSIFYIPKNPCILKFPMKNLKETLKLLLDFKLLSLTFIMAVFMTAYIQAELTIPLFAKKVFGDLGVSIFFTLNAITVICLSIPITSKFVSQSRRHTIVASGFILIGFSFLLCGLTNSALLLALATIVFTVAEILFFPAMDMEFVDSLPNTLTGTVFGISDLAAAMGGGLGTLMGSYLYHLAETSEYGVKMYWLSFTSFLVCFGLLVLNYFFKKIIHDPVNFHSNV